MLDQLWALRDNLIHQYTEYSDAGVSLFLLMAAEVEYDLVPDSLKLIDKEDGEHCLALARIPGYPEKVGVALQPGLVDTIMSNPFTGAIYSHSFRVYDEFSISVGVSKEEIVLAGRDFPLKGFY